MNGSGYIYFASNSSMPGLLKIGVTTSSPSERLPELQSTGVPTPFILESCFRVVETSKAEKRIHAALVKWRQASNREFFQISLSDALKQCLPNIAEFLVAKHNGAEIVTQRIPQAEEQVLIFIARETQKKRRPKREEIQRHFKFSNMKADYVHGALLKRKFVRETSEERGLDNDDYHGGYYGGYKVKVVKLEHAGIQYLLDNNLITQAEL